MSKALQNAPHGAFCNTFDLHSAIIGLENLFGEWPFYTGFTVYSGVFCNNFTAFWFYISGFDHKAHVFSSTSKLSVQTDLPYARM